MAAKEVKQLLLCSFLVLSLSLVSTDSQPWTPGSYPNPSTAAGIEHCGRRNVASRICDPDGVISYESANVVEATIKDIQTPVEPYVQDGCQQHSTSDNGYQVAVALMRKMKTLPGGSPPEAAANFATQLFDDWGVGEASCGNGVLLLLSIGDRQAYIYAGSEAHKAATEAQLSRVIDNMRPMLRAGNYDAAVENAVIDIGLALAGADLRPHKDESESIWPLAAFLSIFSSVIGFTLWSSHKEKRQRRSAQAILDKLMREQATAVSTGRYPAVSCPICFDDFEAPPEPSAPPYPQDGDADTQAGPSREGADAPLLKRRNSKSRESLGQSLDVASKGDKKNPLSLPCGHTFCAPCIQRWMASNTSCPVCRKPLEGASPSPPAPSGQVLRRDMYEDELSFRLGGLNRMYPNIVSQAMMTHARSAVQNGQVINWDSVRQVQISALVRNERVAWGSSGNSTPFFGGSSHGGGGVGGSW
jgi:uncharacterized membrane protein YgcG